MLANLKNLFIALVLSAIPFVLAPNLVAAVDCNSSAKNALQCGADGASGQKDPDPATAATGINDSINTGLNILSAVVGVLAVVMVVVSGLKFITSGGNEEKIKSAKKGLLMAVVGLAIVVMAQLIVKFVLQKTVK